MGEPLDPSSNNVIAENNASGNLGWGIIIEPGYIGNIISHNQALGNILHGDIFGAKALPANKYDNNLCEVSDIRPSLQDICQRPDIAGHTSFKPDGD